MGIGLDKETLCNTLKDMRDQIISKLQGVIDDIKSGIKDTINSEVDSLLSGVLSGVDEIEEALQAIEDQIDDIIPDGTLGVFIDDFRNCVVLPEILGISLNDLIPGNIMPVGLASAVASSFESAVKDSVDSILDNLNIPEKALMGYVNQLNKMINTDEIDKLFELIQCVSGQCDVYLPLDERFSLIDLGDMLKEGYIDYETGEFSYDIFNSENGNILTPNEVTNLKDLQASYNETIGEVSSNLSPTNILRESGVIT